MATPFVGEIRMFGGNFAPAGWAFCDGQLLAISQNDVLFTLIGTTYGGDGQNTFALPDLRGRLPMHQGTGPGLSSRTIGQSGGVEDVTLTTNQLPAHTHNAVCKSGDGDTGNPQNAIPANNATALAYGGTGTPPPLGTMNTAALAPAGGSQPHENMQPFLCVSFIISLFGIFPSQS